MQVVRESGIGDGVERFPLFFKTLPILLDLRFQCGVFRAEIRFEFIVAGAVFIGDAENFVDLEQDVASKRFRLRFRIREVRAELCEIGGFRFFELRLRSGKIGNLGIESSRLDSQGVELFFDIENSEILLFADFRIRIVRDSKLGFEILFLNGKRVQLRFEIRNGGTYDSFRIRNLCGDHVCLVDQILRRRVSLVRLDFRYERFRGNALPFLAVEKFYVSRAVRNDVSRVFGNDFRLEVERFSASAVDYELVRAKRSGIVRFCGFRFVSRTGNENNGTGEQDASRAEIHASTGMVKNKSDDRDKIQVNG